MASTQTSDAEEPEVNQPGLRELREAVANSLGRLRPRASLREDGIAGLNSAVSSVPDGMASGILVGVNPIYGLYACMVGPIAGGIFSSTSLMIVATTSAASLSAGQALGGLEGEARDHALFLMVVLIGALQVLFGILRLGQLTRFVSYSVMTGFITGIAVLTILSQLPTISGYEPTAGNNKVTQTINLMSNLDRVNLWSLTVAVVTLALAILLPRTRLGSFGGLVAIIIPSTLVALFGLDSVQIVRDVGDIPSGIPMPHLPSFSALSFEVLTGALAVAVVTLVQGAGVSQSVPNPDGSRRSMSRDFVAQGAANAASGLFRGLPVGGSLSTTALTVISGARSRWAAIFAGLWMALLVIVFPRLVSYVAMPPLGVLLIIASVSTIKPSEALSIWRTGRPSRLAIITTFLSTLFLPIQAAVGFGVVLSALLYVNESSTDIAVVELVKRDDGLIEEHKPPKQLQSNKVTVLDIYGHLFYAGARTLARLLPRLNGAQNAVVILRLRGRTNIGATLVEVLANYADKLQEANGRLYLTGISEKAYEQVVRTGKLRLTGPVRAYEATPIVWQSTHEAVADARTWLVGIGAEAVSHNEAGEIKGLTPERDAR
ncbi:MAG TPA: SulP family inorganic anion transporter [Pyrinomonadaceae bacterium]|nr:SulP family inorganic anion transporter [Pyrinomonadaceae bacterium]